jgi:polysaccharide biosynthesis/export protein
MNGLDEMGEGRVKPLASRSSDRQPAQNRLISPRTRSKCWLLLGSALLFVLGSCAGSGPYVWVNDAPDTFFRPMSPLTISVGDMINIRVFGQEPLSTKATVRADGAVALPLVGDVVVSGKTPGIVAKEVEARLVPYVTTPNVVVVIEDSRIRITTIGELRKTGTLVLEAGDTGMLAALANSGGLTEYAGKSDIFVLRQLPNGVVRIRFSYDEIVRGLGRAAAFRLHNGDQVIVE